MPHGDTQHLAATTDIPNFTATFANLDGLFESQGDEAGEEEGAEGVHVEGHEGSLVGFHERPRKSARVKSELTLKMPSKAMMWMAVVVSLWRESDTSDICGRGVVADMEAKEETFFLSFIKPNLCGGLALSRNS